MSFPTWKPKIQIKNETKSFKNQRIYINIANVPLKATSHKRERKGGNG
jgi:hypothetical protein